MQRGTNVRPSPRNSRTRKNPPAVAEGSLISVRDARARRSRPGISGAFRSALQARDLVGALMRIDARIAEDEHFGKSRSEDLLSFYRACWRIFEACSDELDRKAFEAITGESWSCFESALDVLGWRLLPPDRRKAIARHAVMVEAGDVFGHNEYAQ